jgi:two-component system response regulator YesN
MKTHRVFIVDDEVLIVKGLRASIERCMPGFVVAGWAYSGDMALKQILQIKPEIVISDIRMKGMDGLELVRNLRQLLPLTKVILLSGYDDFQYAQTAIRSQVFDYLLKPVTDALLEGVLQRVTVALAEQNKEKRYLAELMQHLDNGKPFMRQLLFSTLRSPDLLPTNPVLTLFDMQKDDCMYLTACVRFLEGRDGQKTCDSDKKMFLFEQVCYIFQDMEVDVIPFFEQEMFVLMIRFNREEEIIWCESQAYTVLEKVASMIALNSDNPFCIGVGKVTLAFHEIEESYRLAKEASRYCFCFGTGSVIGYNDIAFTKTETEQEEGFLQDMVLGIRAGTQKTALDYLKEYFESISKHEQSIYHVRHDCLLICMALWHEFGRTCFAESAGDQRLCRTIEDLFICTDIHSIADLLTGLVTEICQTLSGKLLTRNQQFVQQIEEIIERDYATVTLETISSLVHMSPAYTSNLFSSTKGITIRDSIINKRIERAKELLRQSDRKLYEIAAEVGYSDAKYFSQLFRKITGQTPNQYRYR